MSRLSHQRPLLRRRDGEFPDIRAAARDEHQRPPVAGELIDEDPELPPPLEPLVPALAETVLYWSAGGRSVAVVHDEQSALTPGRVDRLGQFLAGRVDPPPLQSFVQVDSREDPRVQVADFLAGIVRRGRPDLVELLEPYLCAAS